MREENINKFKNLKFIGLVLKQNSDLSNEIKVIESILKKYNISLLIEKNSAQKYAIDGYELDEITKKTNLIISLGGDGTLISVCRNLALKDVYVLGIYAGTLGFLTDFKIDEFEQTIKDILNAKYEIQSSKMLEITFIKGKKSIKKIAFNDVFLSRDCLSSVVKIDAYLNDKFFNTYLGDGVIVCSPAGSTAYNMSANGPIIYPLCDVFCVTPICSHSLTQRPLILPKQNILSFKSDKKYNIKAVIDGQEMYNMQEFDSINIRLNKAKANLIKNSNISYFDVLKEKLKWGGESK